MVSISQEREMDDANQRRRVTLPAPLVLNVLMLILAGLVAYFSAYNALNARVAVLESQYQLLHSDLQEIKGDVKTLLERGR